jgi:hypothetical protein
MRRIGRSLASIMRAHQQLPRVVRLQYLVPITVVVVAVLGLGLTLPPGPLCDEGMALFMEGGCDWGESNVFFYSKLGLMLSLVMAFAVAWRGRVRGFTGFVPHLAVAAVLAYLTRSGGMCDTYYTHANGSIGQMVVEVTGWSVLGIAILRRWSGGPWQALLGVAAGWCLAYVGGFYAWLPAFPHWSWAHTVAVTSTLVAAGVASRPRA